MSRAARWGGEFAAWTVVGVFFASQTFVGASYTGRPLTWPQAMGVALVSWYVRAAFAPGVRWLARRVPLSRRGLRRALLVHVPVSVAGSMLAASVIRSVCTALLGMSPAVVSPVEFHTSLLTYWALVGITHGAEYYRRYRDRQLAASRLEAQLTSARLDALRSQLHPHFLFNTLHGISELMHEDVDRAEAMLEHLSELLRLSLRHAAEPEVALRDELAFVRRYLEIEQMRFQDRLAVSVAVDPDALDVRVPHLLLQPLVENAIRHGVAPRVGPGRVTIAGGVDGGALRLEVADDGPGMPAGRPPPEGVGVGNTRARLRARYGEAATLELANRPEGGVRAVVRLPV